MSGISTRISTTLNKIVIKSVHSISSHQWIPSRLIADRSAFRLSLFPIGLFSIPSVPAVTSVSLPQLSNGFQWVSSYSFINRFQNSFKYPTRNSDDGDGDSSDELSEELPQSHRLLAEDLKRQSSRSNLKYWLVYSSMVAAGTMGGYTILKMLKGSPSMAVSFPLAVLSGSYIEYASIKSQGGKRIALHMKGIPIEKGRNEKHNHVLETVKKLSTIAGLPVVPQCYIIPTSDMNAFAAGLDPKDSVVAVTQGLLDRLNKDELTAVLGHEVGHLSNRDTVRAMHLIAINAGLFGVSKMGLDILKQKNKSNDNKKDDGQMVGIILLGMGAVTFVMGILYHKSISRTREHAADESCVAYTSKGNHLISALKKISNYTDENTTPNQGILHEFENSMLYSHMYLNNPRKNFLSTHPTVEERIKNISSLQQKLGQKSL